MNREIKFRGYWQGQVLEVMQIDYRIPETVILTDGTTDNINVPLENVKLMQYTGLKDKNGKEIYEGDIVNCEKRGPAFYHSKVIYNAINARYEVVAMGCPFPLRLEPGLDEDISIGGIDYEVIGNIYENPELLNQLN